MNRTDLIQQLLDYKTSDEEIEFVPKFLDLLEHSDAFQRHHLPGHITGSAWIIDPTKEFVLLTHHAKLKRWLQPGGHADGDENILGVALREAQEETGLTDFKLLQSTIFDIDIHTIPARKEMREHLHYDVRFLFEADTNAEIRISEESINVEWVRLHLLKEMTNHNDSILRMARKLEVR